MKINSSEIIKKMRKDMGISQEVLAEQLYISPRQVQRIESGEAGIDIWQFMSMLELLGQPTEDFWILYLDTKEYDDYRMYRRIKRLIHARDFSEVRDILPEFEEGLLSKQPFIRQFIAYVKVKVDKEIPPKQAIEKLYEAIHMSKPDFDESKVSEYRLTYNEISTLIELASRLFDMGEKDRAIALKYAMIESRGSLRASEEDMIKILPALMSNLSTMLGISGRYKECLKVCERAVEICREYRNYHFIPVVLHNMASALKDLGEEEQIYKPHLVRAYHCAYAMGQIEIARLLKKDAEEDFGIMIS